jgi:hypothetical protein
VHLRLDAGGGTPKVQPQATLTGVDGNEGEPGPTWVEQVLATAAHEVRDERFEPRPGDQCPRCEFRRLCPAQPEGRQVVE